MVNGIVGMGARAPQVVVVRENEKKKAVVHWRRLVMLQ